MEMRRCRKMIYLTSFNFLVETPEMKLEHLFSFLFERNIQARFGRAADYKHGTCALKLCLTDLPVRFCAARGDVEEEKKPTDQREQLHV